jgi:hypothetical protein
MLPTRRAILQNGQVARLCSDLSIEAQEDKRTRQKQRVS